MFYFIITTTLFRIIMKRVGEDLSKNGKNDRDVKDRISNVSIRLKINTLITNAVESSNADNLSIIYNTHKLQFDSSNLAYLLSCVANLNIPFDTKFINQLIDHIKTLAHTFENANIIVVLNAISKLYSLIGDCDEIYPILTQNVTCTRLPNVEAVNLLHAFAMVGWYDSEIIGKLILKIDTIMFFHERLDVAYCCDAIKSIAYFSIDNLQITADLLDRIVRDVQKLDTGTIIMVLLSAAVQNSRKEDVFLKLVSNIKGPVTDHSQNYQLLYVYIYALFDLKSIALSKKLRCNFDFVLCSRQGPSDIISDMMFHLMNMGIKSIPNHSVSGIIVDLIIGSTIIEFGRKGKYLRQSTQLIGCVKLKLKLLTIMGYNTIVVPYYEYRICMSTEEKMNYIRSLRINV